ncbi:porphobilinogen synthase [Natranaerofaba carboxydovora]|uniref:porphobilinogen synthase n=1 Tax=Natranaerofaba carboxydovora TaxID=2742683 RepID=UPI001F13E589|nr:porphobilinogen synthase [Natranaerofaba carboxydovora]UMZ74285.1 Delta-aminolevulinic acid dehydratase [Natranaerofaba carboxydovora]
MEFPLVRMRRFRKNETLRRMLRETCLQPSDLIFPIIVTNGTKVKNPVPSMPGVYQYSVDEALKVLEHVNKLSIPAIILFGIPDYKDDIGSSAKDKNEAVQKACRAIKDKYPGLIIITDVCLCEYTNHGHCGLVDNEEVLNDATLEELCEISLSHVEAGADMVAPSNMMDGYVSEIRKGLDEKGYIDTPIMAYSAKFSSAFYGPFREAAQSSPTFGDRQSYQMDPSNKREAVREVELDIREGADIVMVKPALNYLDIIYSVKEKFSHPIAAYSVSGEYAMIKAAAEKGWIDEKEVTLQTLRGIKRAGAEMIITYSAIDVASWIEQGYY